MFGLTLTDYFTGSPYKVELEKDLSLKQQFLDVLIISETGEKQENQNKPAELPDGFDNLGVHNLLTYKSHQESLNAFTVNELIGHYANYCKLVSQPFNHLLPEEAFRLYAVSTRFPLKLSKRIAFKDTPCPGIYDIKWGVFNIRVIVLSRIAKTEKNAPWLMFSAKPDKVKYGADCYQWKTPVSTIMNQLFEKYNVEGVFMAYTIEDYLKESREQILSTLTRKDIDIILGRLRPEEVLKRFKPEEVFERFKPEDRLKGLRAEDRLKGLRAEEIETYLNKIKQKRLS